VEVNVIIMLNLLLNIEVKVIRIADQDQ